MELLLFPCLLFEYLLLVWSIRTTSNSKALVFLLLSVLVSVIVSITAYKLGPAHLFIIWFHIGWWQLSRRSW